MRNLITEQEIMSQWKGDPSTPVVSICCTTYNHEPFIEDALEGFLIQETDFPFEILIHDDASTDKTAEIIRKYEKKYPSLIKPIYQDVNQYSIGRKPMPEFNYPRAKGKYIAICEGDDYWTDPKKLQIQIEFLENNPNYVISGHEACIIDEKGTMINESKLPDAHKRDFNQDEVIKIKAWILTMSMVFRNVLNGIQPEQRMVKNGDAFLTSILGYYGKSKFHDDIQPAVYRSHQGGIWSKISERDKFDSSLNTFFWLYRYYKRLGDEEYSDYFWNYYSIRTVSKIDSKILKLEIKNRFMSFIKRKLKF